MKHVLLFCGVVWMLCVATGCVAEETLVSVKNGTPVDIYDVRYSDCYWPGPLSSGATSSPACIPAQTSDQVTFSLLSEFETTPPPVGRPPDLNVYESIEPFLAEEEGAFLRFEVTFQNVQIVSEEDE